MDIGAYHGPAVAAPALVEHFNGAITGAAPAGWTVSGPVPGALIGTDPAGGYGKSLLLSRQAGGDLTVDHAFTAAGGEVRVDARLRAEQTGAPLGLHLLDAAGTPVAQVSLAADGYAALTDAGTWTDTAFAYPTGVWLRVGLVLHPATGAYDVYVDDTRVGGGRLTPGSGTASQARLRVQTGTGAASFAADDLLVQPLA